MVSLEVIAIVLTGVGVIISVLYYSMVLQNSNKARQAQLYVQIWNQFNSQDFFEKYFDVLNQKWEDYEDYQMKYGNLRFTDTKKYAKNVSIGAYFEGVGVLLKHGLIDIDLVVDLMGTTILFYWDKISPIIKEFRVRNRNSRAYHYLEYLYEHAKPIILQQHPEIKEATPPKPDN